VKGIGGGPKGRGRKNLVLTLRTDLVKSELLRRVPGKESLIAVSAKRNLVIKAVPDDSTGIKNPLGGPASVVKENRLISLPGEKDRKEVPVPVDLKEAVARNALPVKDVLRNAHPEKVVLTVQTNLRFPISPGVISVLRATSAVPEEAAEGSERIPG
jgi:hypothetical protein